MFMLLLLLSTFSLVSLSPVAEPEPEPEAEAEPSAIQYYSLQRSVVGFYTPVYYQYHQDLHPGYTYRFGPPLPSQHLTDVTGDAFRNAFNRAFRQYISSGLFQNNQQTGDITVENITSADPAWKEVESQDPVITEEDPDDNESDNEDARDTDMPPSPTPVIEISK